MKLVLKPVSYPEMGKIIIKTSPFLIGRHESHFASLPCVASLSRRHARIFEEQGTIYLIDLGSLNGTALNGRPIRGQLETLHTGDEICLAEEWRFNVEVKNGVKSVPKKEPAFQLTLVPQQENGEATPISITHFPFLINETAGAFTGDSNAPSAENGDIPHAHALIFLRDDDVYVEDLGNTGGTFVSGSRLEETTCLLREGDTISFGRNPTAYLVKIKNKAAAAYQDGDKIVLFHRDKPLSVEQTDAQLVKTSAANKTTFLSTATSFLRMFLNQDAAAPTTPLTNAPAGESQTPARTTFQGKVRAFLAEIRRTMVGNWAPSAKVVWSVAIIGIILLLLIGGIYLKGSTEREIRNLLDEEQFAEAAAVANDYLKNHPENTQISALGTEALVEYSVPHWMEKLENQRFAEADAFLAETKDLSQSNADGQQVLDMLNWIGDLEELYAQRGEEAPIIIFNHEMRMQALLDWWEQNSTAHHQLLNKTIQYVPTFETLHERSSSHLNRLRSAASIYLKAIDHLKATVRENLAANRPAELFPVLENFEKTYPKIHGVQQLYEDLEKFLAIQKSIHDKNLSVNNCHFSTPPFQEAGRQLCAKLLPPELAEQYQKARNAWRSGETPSAMALLEPLTREKWGEVATPLLRHYKETVKAYEELRATPQSSADYAERLFAFRHSLDSVEDKFFWNAIETDFQRHAIGALDEAQQTFQRAREDWHSYQKSGGIDGLLRLEPSVSDTFQQRAGQLSNAYIRSTQGIRIYDKLDQAYPAEWQKLHEQIVAEVKRQRRWLNDLDMVLEPPLLQAKLALLPTLPENTQ